MKIYIPIFGLTKSGGDRTIVNLINYLAIHNHEVFVINVREIDGYYSIHPNVKIISAKLNYRNLLCDFLYFYRNINNDGIVIANYYLTFIPSFFCANNKRLYYLVQGYECGIGSINSKNRFRGFLRSIVASITYMIPSNRMYVSFWLKNKIERTFKFPRARSVVIGNGLSDIFIFSQVESQKINRSSELPTKIGFLFSESVNKGSKLAIEVISELKKKFSLDVYIVGAPLNSIPFPYTSFEVSSDADMIKFYQQLDLFLFLSIEEGFGLPPLEAMSQGVIPLLTDSGGVQMYAKNLINCIMFENRSRDDIVNSISLLLFNRILLNKLKINALLTASNCRMENSYKLLIDFLKL